MKKRLLASLLIAFTALLALFAVTACTNKTANHLYFVVDGETTEITAYAGDAVTVEQPTKGGYVFDGWYLTENCTGEKVAAPSVMPAQDATYYGHFLKQSTLTVQSVEGNATYTVTEGTVLSAFLADKKPSADGLIFGGWFVGASELSETYKMPASDLTVEARFKVEYTLEIIRQNYRGSYPPASVAPETETRVDWVGATVDPQSFNFDHFTVDEEKTDMTPVTLAKGTVVTLYLERNEYIVVYYANAPQGAVVKGETPSSSAYYQGSLTIAECGFSVEGYRFAGWSLAPDDDADADYLPGTEYDMYNGSFALHAQWDKGYTDRFGGNDLIFQPALEKDAVYLRREGLDEKKGTYDAATRIFTFVTDAGEELKGRLTPTDGTFAYYGNENPNSYRLIDAYTSEEIEDKDWTLVLDEYDGAALTVDRKTYTGHYSVDEESGDFIFVGDAGTPDEYKTFYFLTGTYGDDEKPGFAIRGAEYGVYADPDSLIVGLLDGYGLVYVFDYNNGTTSYGFYEFDEDYAKSREISVRVLVVVNGAYVLSDPQIWKLLDYDYAYDAILMKVRDAYLGRYKEQGSDQESLVLDGYGEGVFIDTNGAHSGSYTLNDNILFFNYRENGQDTRVILVLNAEDKTYTREIGAEMGSYYLYNVEEGQLYTRTLYLDGKGGATWYTFRSQKGTYVYDAATHIVVCTSSDGEFSFLLTEKPLGDAMYPAYIEHVDYVGEFAAENGGETLALDGFIATYLGKEYYYTVTTRTGFKGMTFVFLYEEGEIKHSLLAHDTNLTFTEIRKEVGTYAFYAYSAAKEVFTTVDDGGYYHNLTLNNDGTASLVRTRGWDGNTTLALGTYELIEGDLYLFTVNEQYAEYGNFEFRLTALPNGSPAFMRYDSHIAYDYHSEDGTETLTGDGYGKLTYTVNGEVLASGRFSVSTAGLLQIPSSNDEKFEFLILDEANGIFRRAGQESRLYTLYDPSSSEQLRIVLDGNGGAYLVKYNSDTEHWGDPFVYGTYARTSREGEWEFISNSPALYESFRFILPNNAPYIAFMKYNPESDGRFDADNWAILILDGYGGYYAGATYIEANGRVHTGLYTTSGAIVVFEDENGREYYLKLLPGNSFKRLGDELGTYMYYDPIRGTIYSTPTIFFDGEGGATISFDFVGGISGTYEPYGEDEYIITYVANDKELTMRIRVMQGTYYLLFVLHEDIADGTFTSKEGGKLVLDGYKNAELTENGKHYSGYYYSADEIPLSDGKLALITFVGLVDGGNANNEDDVLVAFYVIDHNDGSFVAVTEEAGSYKSYSPTRHEGNETLFLDGRGNAFLYTYDSATSAFKWVAGSYVFDMETSEGTYTIDGTEQKFYLWISQSYYGNTYYFTKYEEEVAGTFTDDAGNVLELDGFGYGTYTPVGGDPIYGYCYFYFSDYITDYTVVLVDEFYNEYFFKLYRENAAGGRLGMAGEEANNYFTYVVNSTGATIGRTQILLLDGNGLAEIYEYQMDGNFQYVLVNTIQGTYEIVSASDDLTTTTFKFTPNDGTAGFLFQIRYVQAYYGSELYPCFVRYDANYAYEYTLGEGETQQKLTLDGYELATYTDGEGNTYSGTYYREGDTVYFIARDESGKSFARATFKVSNNGDGSHTFEIVSQLA